MKNNYRIYKNYEVRLRIEKKYRYMVEIEFGEENLCINKKYIYKIL